MEKSNFSEHKTVLSKYGAMLSLVEITRTESGKLGKTNLQIEINVGKMSSDSMSIVCN